MTPDSVLAALTEELCAERDTVDRLRRELEDHSEAVEELDEAREELGDLRDAVHVFMFTMFGTYNPTHSDFEAKGLKPEYKLIGLLS